MPADGVLDIDLACLRGGLSVWLATHRPTVFALACHPAVCMVPDGPQAIPFVAWQVPMSARGVR